MSLLKSHAFWELRLTREASEFVSEQSISRPTYLHIIYANNLHNFKVTNKMYSFYHFVIIDIFEANMYFLDVFPFLTKAMYGESIFFLIFGY